MKYLFTILLSIFLTLLFSQNISSNFDNPAQGANGWTVLNAPTYSVSTPTYRSTGGTPNGCISAAEGSFSLPGFTLYFSAPAKFLGNKRDAYNNMLSFDLRSEGSGPIRYFSEDDVVLEGSGIRLVYSIDDPRTTWQHADCLLNEASWTVGNRNGPIATKAQLQTVLCNISRLMIRSEYISGADEGFLDNVTLNITPCPPRVFTQTKTLCRGQSITLNGKIYNTTGNFRDTIRRCPQCDSIIVLNLTVISAFTSTQNLTICQGKSVTVGTKTYTQTGVYTDILKSISGCDSIVTTNLTVLAPLSKTQNFIICQGNSVIVGTKTYTQTGVYKDTVKNILGCDSSITTINLTVNPIFNITQNPTICQGNSVTVGTKTYTQSGGYIDILKTISGCDSIITTNLTVLPPLSKNQNLSICQGDFIKIGAKTYTQTGIFKDTLKTLTGCDSIVTTNLTVNPIFNKSQNSTICQGNSIIVGTKTYTQAGTYIDILKTISGCDSIITTNLTVLPPLSKTQVLSICQGDFIKIGAKTYNQTGVFRDTLKTIMGCDSIVTTNLTVNQTYARTQNVSICPNTVFPIGTHSYAQAGTYRDTFRTINGCDSVIITALTVKSVATINQDIALCAGQSFKVGTKAYTQTGIYRDTFHSLSGCDSIITTNLTVNPNVSKIQTLKICAGDFVNIGAKTYTKTGVFIDTLKTKFGCDSVVTTNLTVIAPLSKNQNFTICEGDFIKIGTKTYTQTGILKDTFKSALGCDSIIVTNLTVIPRVSKIQNRAICPTSSLTIGIHNYTQAGTYVDTLKTLRGCDSIVTTVLTVQAAITRLQNITFCAGESVKIGTRVYAQTGIFKDTFRAVSNCDSIVITNLTVIAPLSKTQVLSICQGDFIKIGAKTYNQTAIFKDTLKAITGCDSIVTTNLTVIAPLSKTQVLSICAGDFIKIGAKTYNQAGVFKDTLKAVSGCDSIVTTNLTVNKKYVQTQSVAICPTSALTVGTHTYRQAGTYLDSLRSSKGCDSIVTTVLSIQTSSSRTQSLSFCNGQTYKIGTHIYKETGIYRDTLRSATNCDSIVISNLTFESVFVKTQNLNICEGNFIKVGTKTYNRSGFYIDSLKTMSGCDSIVFTILIVNPTYFKTQNISICYNSSLVIRSHTYTQAGTYRDTLTTINGCDSIITTILTVKPIIARTQNMAICTSQSIKIGNHTYTQTGTYRDTLQAFSGCDSIVTTNLTVTKSISIAQNISICEGDYVRIGGNIYTQFGVFVDTLQAIAGCDSIITTNIRIKPPSIKQLDTTICESSKLVIKGKTYTQSGIFRETIRRTGNCDSIFQISLTVQPLILIKNKVVLCPNDPVLVNGRVRQAGIYRDTIPLTLGCPQIVEWTIQESKLKIDAGADMTIEQGDSIRLNAALPSAPDMRWGWQQNKALSCTICPNPYVKPSATTIFMIEATDTVNNCTVRDAVTVTVKSCANIYLPTVFTPNNDGNNDYFTVFGSGCVKKVRKMMVFNRWGAMVFVKENFLPNSEQNGWDGTMHGALLMPDVYTYVMELEVGDGKLETMWGDVTLMR